MDRISQDWEDRVKVLKEAQLEKILIGKLNGFGFDYFLLNKEVQVVDKLFWTGEEIKELLNRKRKLRSFYQKFFT